MRELLLVATGVSAWLAVYNFVIFAIRRQRLSLWIAMWSTSSLVYQLARYRQSQGGDAGTLRLIDQLCMASALWLMALVLVTIRELTGSRALRRTGQGILSCVAVASVLNPFTGLMIGHQVGSFVSFSGHVVQFTRPGPLYAPLMLSLALVEFLVLLVLVRGSSVLTAREKVVWVVALLAYQVLGSNDLMLFSGLTAALLPGLPGQTLFEFGALCMTAAFSLRTARRAEFSQQQLETLVGRRTQELETALAASRAAAEAKATFLASMSHEIRTPLNGILGLTELLMDEALPVSAKERLGLVLRSGSILKALVDDVLDFAKLDARRLTLTQAEVDLPATLRDVVALYEGSARERGLRLGVELTDLPALVISDEQRLRQIVANLVNNAIKFTEHGEVRVKASALRGDDGRAAVTIDIIDTGAGISATDQLRLFKPFSQVGVSMKAPGRGGTGLGLVICLELVELLGGTLTLRSDLGQGSTFSICLQLEVRSWAPQPKLAAPSVPHRQFQARVLVAEDNQINRLVAEGMLRSMGLQPTMVTDGEEAVAAAASGGFELIFMDCQMPLLDGFEATRALRAKGDATPIVALTAYASEEDRQRCLEAGMNDYLTKPLRKRELEGILGRYLTRTVPVSA